MWNDVPDRPLEPPPELDSDPICPVCSAACDFVYKRDGEIIGCDVCIEECSAWEESECTEPLDEWQLPMR